MKGAYTLIIEVSKPITIHIRSLGKIVFAPGFWVYIGSAMGEGSTNLENRLNRHFRKEKSIHWHIDYLLEKKTTILEAIWTETQEHIECELAQSIGAQYDFMVGPKRFGSSDCSRGCAAHIYLYKGNESPRQRLIEVFHELGLQTNLSTDGQLGL